MSITKFFEKYTKSVSKSLFIKFFLACTLISLFLVIIIGSYTRFYILKNLDSEIEKFERKKINETINTMNVLFGEMQKLSLNHAMNSKFLQFAYLPRDVIAEKQLEVKSIQELLSNSINSSNYIRNIAIYYEKNDYVLDYSGPMGIESYYDKGWYDDYCKMMASSLIMNTRKVNDRNRSSDYSHNNVITFITRIPYDNESKEGAIILSVDEKIISDLLKNITYGDDHTLAFLVNKDGMVISSNKDNYIYENISNIINIPSGYMDLNNGSFDFKMQETKMISYFETSRINGWKLFYIVSENKIYERSAYIKYMTIIILAILLLLMTAVSLAFSFRLYNPIKKIILNIKKMMTVNDDNLSDVLMIQDSIKMLLENNQTLEKQLDDNKVLVREIFLSQLISGKLFNRNEIKNRAEYFMLNLDFDFFKVAVIKIGCVSSNYISIDDLEFKKISLINIVDKVFNDLDIEVVCSQDSDDNVLILLKLYSVEKINEVEAIIEQALEDIKDSTEKFLSIPVSIGIGRMYNDISNIGVSYKEAIEALNHKFLKGDESVISYTDIMGSKKEKLYYPIEMEQKIISLIKLCDYDKTILILNDMINDIMDHNKSFQHIEICLSNISGIIERCIFDLNLNIHEVFGKDDIPAFSIDKFKSIQQFMEWISSKFRTIIEYQIDQQKDNTKSFVSEIKEFIEENYVEEISLVTAAAHFNYNSSYFCKIFKEKTGVSFWEYVSKVRIEKSKSLLIETDNSIEQIAEMVGYNNRFSYIRSFKKYTSITPGEYRMKYQI
ncbi:MAG TPA: AraC family transcriptional regulator [Clostridiales bacterium]|nr:AraC family transcriptional regulator [Clostridiales bacterium]